MSIKQLKSISVLVSFDKVQNTLLESGFVLSGEVTIISGGKFWQKMLFTRSDETVSVSEEIGDAYPKDPIITICGYQKTITNIIDGVEDSVASL